MRNGAIAIALVVLVAGGLGVGYYFYQASSLPNTGTNSTTYIASNPDLGIRLTISLNATIIHVRGTVNYTASVYNTRPSENNVSSASNWTIPRLISTACGLTDGPIAFAIMPGHYVPGNISQAPSMNYGMMCTTVMGGVTVYSFQATSDTASVIGNCNPNPCFTRPVSTWRPFSGYPSGEGADVNWVKFTAGVYTVVAEDEWGDIALASFTVT